MRTAMYAEEEQRRHSPMDRAIRRTGLVCDEQTGPDGTEVKVRPPPRSFSAQPMPLIGLKLPVLNRLLSAASLSS